MDADDDVGIEMPKGPPFDLIEHARKELAVVRERHAAERTGARGAWSAGFAAGRAYSAESIDVVLDTLEALYEAEKCGRAPEMEVDTHVILAKVTLALIEVWDELVGLHDEGPAPRPLLENVIDFVERLTLRQKSTWP